MAPRDLWERKLLHDQESKLWFLSPSRSIQHVGMYPHSSSVHKHIACICKLVHVATANN